jgi:hypothetical protein
MPTQITVTVGPGQDYDSMSAALTGVLAQTGGTRDLVARDEMVKFLCHPFQDATWTVSTSWTTGASNFIEVEAVGSHGGAWNTNIYRAHWAVSNGVVVNIGAGIKAVLRGVQIYHTTTSGAALGLTLNGDGTDVTLEECIIRGNWSTSTIGRGVGPAQVRANLRFRMRNCLIYGFRRSINVQMSGGGNVAIYNTLAVHGADTGVYASASGSNTSRLWNVVSIGRTTAEGPPGNDFLGWTSGAVGGTHGNNSSSDGTAVGSNPHTWVEPSFVDESTGVFYPTASDTVTIGTGANLSADATYPFAVDMIGTSRPQGTDWDRGPFEYVLGAVNNRPDTPAILSATPTATGVTVVGDTYSDPEADPHTATRVRIYEQGGGSPVHTETVGALETVVVPDNTLQPNTLYEATIAYADAGGFGLESESVEFMTTSVLQLAPPVAVTVAGGYTTDQGSSVAADILAALQDIDAAYVRSPLNPNNAALEVQLAEVLTASGHEIAYEYGKLEDNAVALNQTVQLRSEDGSTVVRQWVHTDVGLFPQTAVQDISDLVISGQMRVRFLDTLA